MIQEWDQQGLDTDQFHARLPSMGGRIERRTVAAQLANQIEREIRAGAWVDDLPGKRTLADRFTVNVKTAAAAIDLLECRGLVGPARAGKSRAILPPPAGADRGSKRKGERLLIIHQSDGGLNLDDHELIRQMASVWEKVEGEVVWAAVDFPRCKSPDSQLETLIERHLPHALLLLSPGAGWHRAAAGRIPCYMAGGPFEGELPISLGACALDIEVKRIVNHLRALGHRRILAPSTCSSDRLWRAIVDGLKTGAGDKPEIGIWQDYCPIFSERVPEAWAGYWSKSFNQLRPTAVIVFEDIALLSLYGYCHAKGLLIPRDVSVVSMNYDPRFAWMNPRPTMMRYPFRSALAHFRQWIKGGLKPLGRRYFTMQIVEGTSVARPKAVSTTLGRMRSDP
jgi:hypothetical protein